MATSEAKSAPVRSRRLPRPRRWARKLIPVLFVIALVVAATMTVRDNLARDRRASAGNRAARGTVPAFSHSYPPNPVEVERPKVSGPPPHVPSGHRISGNFGITSLPQLVRRLPVGTLVDAGDHWFLRSPVSFAGGATLSIKSASRIYLGPNAFIEAETGGSVVLQDQTVMAANGSGRTLEGPSTSAGYLDAIDGGRLVLVHDRFVRLGHAGVEAYGISMREPGIGSRVSGCTIEGDYIGVYLSHAAGVSIVGNWVLDSVVYGIDPHTDSTGILIQSNVVRNSGVHGIILAAGVIDSQIVSNVVEDSHLHGIVLYQGSNGDLVRGNIISRAFDGIVLIDSSSSTISANTMRGVQRFGLRVSGTSTGNVFVGNVVTGALVGAYLYGGAAENVLRDNQLTGRLEIVRVRSDAPGNRVSPVPPRSEVSP